MARLEANDVPFAPERKIDEITDDPQAPYLNLFYELAHPKYGKVKGMRRLMTYDGGREAHLRPPSGLGEHTAEILRKIGIRRGPPEVAPGTKTDQRVKVNRWTS